MTHQELDDIRMTAYYCGEAADKLRALAERLERMGGDYKPTAAHAHELYAATLTIAHALLDPRNRKELAP